MTRQTAREALARAHLCVGCVRLILAGLLLFAGEDAVILTSFGGCCLVPLSVPWLRGHAVLRGAISDQRAAHRMQMSFGK
jgi:hypothetical protein